MKRPILWVLGLIVVSFCVCSGIVPQWFVEVPFHVATGWVTHLRTVGPLVRVNWAGTGVFVIALPVTALLAHSFAKWLWSSFRPTEKPWRWKWTLLGLATVMLMFVAGIGATGVVHQTGWLITSKEKLVVSNSRRLANKIKCRSQLQQIGQALEIYANEHGGYRPVDQADFVRVMTVSDVVPELFVCPSSTNEAARGTDWAKQLGVPDVHGDDHLSYIYCEPTILGPDGKHRARMDESFENHDSEGLNVLYENGVVEWVDQKDADIWFAGIKATSTTSPTK